MIIRHAVEEDIPALTAFIVAFSHAAGLPPANQADTADFLGWMLEHPRIAILLVADDGAPIGLIGALVNPLFFNRAVLGGQELFWWVDPARRGGAAARRLLGAMEDELRRQGATRSCMGSLDASKGEAVGRMLARTGYRPAERSYVKEL